MTKREAAIVSAYTGFSIGDVSEFHRYIEQLLGRQVFTHELADGELWETIRQKAKPDFVAIEVS